MTTTKVEHENLVTELLLCTNQLRIIVQGPWSRSLHVSQFYVV